MRFEKTVSSENAVEGYFATSEGMVCVSQDVGALVITDAEGDMTAFFPDECAQLWPALKAFSETGDIRNADYGPRVTPLPVKENGFGGFGALFVSHGEEPCMAGIAQDSSGSTVMIRKQGQLDGPELDRDTAERLALVLLRFAKTGRIEEQFKDVGETIDPAANCE